MTRRLTGRMTRMTGAWAILALALAPPAIAQPAAAQADAPAWLIAAPGTPAAQPTPLPTDADFTRDIDLPAAIDAAGERLSHFVGTEPTIASSAIAVALDPEAAFALIRDLRTDPYQGHLRDPDAVLAAGGGNDADKAAALVALLAEIGMDARLVSAPAGPAPATCAPRSDAAVAALAGLGPQALARIDDRARAEYARLSAAAEQMPPAEADAGPGDGSRRIWVQMRDDAGGWVDLDPAVAGAAWGAAPAGGGAEMAEPPAPHIVTIGVEVETLADGRLSTDSVLAAEYDASAATEQRLSLVFQPDVEGLGGSIGAKLRSFTGEAGARIKPVILMPEDARDGRDFPVPGRAGTGTDILGEAIETDIVTAVTLLVGSTAPDAPDRAERRPVLDLVPPARRAALAADPEARLEAADLVTPPPGELMPAPLEGIWQIVISNGGLSRQLAALRGLDTTIAVPELIAAAEAATGGDPERLLWSGWTQAAATALTSEEVIRARALLDGTCAAVARPRVLIASVIPDGSGGYSAITDWTLDEIAVAGGGGLTADNARRQRLWHGALQHALETEVQQVLLPGGAAMAGPPPTAPLVPADPAGLPPEAAGDAAAGYALLTAPDTGPDSWWRVLPASGQSDLRLAAAGNGAKYAKAAGGAVDFSQGFGGISKGSRGGMEGTTHYVNEKTLSSRSAAELNAAKKGLRTAPRPAAPNEYSIVVNVSLAILADAALTALAYAIAQAAYMAAGQLAAP